MKKMNDQPINEIMTDWVNKYRLKPKLYQTKIESIWGDMMGPMINKYTRNIQVRRKKLYIEISSAPLRQELSYGKSKIKENINKELGEEYIKDVIIL